MSRGKWNVATGKYDKHTVRRLAADDAVKLHDWIEIDDGVYDGDRYVGRGRSPTKQQRMRLRKQAVALHER